MKLSMNHQERGRLVRPCTSGSRSQLINPPPLFELRRAGLPPVAAEVSAQNHSTHPRADGPSALRSRAGFTMVEIAIAIGVIGFALVAIIGILPSGLEVQRDNRTETIINQDGTFWLEAIRNGARGLQDLPSYVDRIEINGPGRNEVISNFAPGQAGSTEIIGLLTTQAGMPDNEVIAYAWSVSGAAAEKEPNKA